MRFRALVPSTRSCQRWLSTQSEASSGLQGGVASTSKLPMENIPDAPIDLQPRAFTSSAEGCLLSNTVPLKTQPEHGLHVATLHFRSYTPSVAQLNLAVEFARRTTHALKIPCSNVVSLPTRTELQTVPTGPFVHKKSQENFWRRTHKRALKLWDADEETLGVCLNYLRAQAVPGVGIRVQQVLYRSIGGFGGQIHEQADNSLETGHKTDAKIKALAEDIIQQEASADSAGSTGEQVSETEAAAAAAAEVQVEQKMSTGV